MLYRLVENHLCSCPDSQAEFSANAGLRLGIFALEDTPGELPGSLPDTFPKQLAREALLSHTPRFISHEALDYICLNLPDRRNLLTRFRYMHIFLLKDSLWILCEDAPMAVAIGNELEKLERVDSYSALLGGLFRYLLADDAAYLEHMEEGITHLEDEVLTDKQKNYTRRIISLRKQLTVLGRYYEQLLDIFDDIEDNENGLLDGIGRKRLRILGGRIGRLAQNVAHLRDYVTQIRDAYQAEVDISLNKTMKLFTVLTAIFLPLTLIAGWYGMNFDMPEYHSPWGYAIVAGVSIAIVVATIVAFRRKKWF